ncbi:MAG TPA: hypothetical protein VIH42_12075 [Thermoguttaceae bacterium]
MTALDQAFIKAYRQQEPAAKSVPLENIPPAPGPIVEIDRTEGSTASTSPESKSHDAATVLKKTPGKILHTHAAEENSPAPTKKHRTKKPISESSAYISSPSKQKTKNQTAKKGEPKKSPIPSLEESDSNKTVYRLDPPDPSIPSAPRATSFTSSLARETVSAQDDPNSLFENKSDSIPRVDLPATDLFSYSNIRVFRPMLQVDHFAWPKVCLRLETTAPVELNRLTEALLALRQKGMRVVAMGGPQRGEGATTLLLCAARQLVSRSMKTVIVDADLGEPQLAKRLGLLPQLGWEDVAAGRQPVEEVLVESTADNLVVLPVCTPFSVSDLSVESQRRMIESLDTLRKNFDLALMDLGPLENPQSLNDLAAGGLNCSIDAVMLVYNIGKTQTASLEAAQQSLASTGVAVAGVIENFVRNPLIPDP